MIEVGDADFRRMVAAEVARIPDAVRAKLENVAFVVEDEVSDAQRRELGMGPGEDLLGLFEGHARGEEVTASGYLPPKITLFRLAILDECETREELEREIHHTLWHEVAHYLGLDEGDVQHAEHVHEARKRD